MLEQIKRKILEVRGREEHIDMEMIEDIEDNGGGNPPIKDVLLVVLILLVVVGGFILSQLKHDLMMINCMDGSAIKIEFFSFDDYYFSQYGEQFALMRGQEEILLYGVVSGDIEYAEAAADYLKAEAMVIEEGKIGKYNFSLAYNAEYEYYTYICFIDDSDLCITISSELSLEETKDYFKMLRFSKVLYKE